MRYRLVPASWWWFLMATAVAVTGVWAGVVLVLQGQSVVALLVGATCAPLFAWFALKSVVIIGPEFVRPGAWWEAKPVRIDDVRQVLSQGFNIVLWLNDGRQVVVAQNIPLLDPASRRTVRRVDAAIARRAGRQQRSKSG